MFRWCLLFVGVFTMMHPRQVEAQHGHFGFGYHGYSQTWVVNPGLGYSGYPGLGYGRTLSYQVGSPGMYYLPGQYSPQPVQPVFQTIPANTVVSVKQKSVTERSQVPVVASSPAARLRSLEHQARGDQKLREQKWSEARAAYRSCVDAAPDRADGHLRLGLCLVAIQRFEPAIHEFKRAVFIDPQIPRSGPISKAIFGPDSKMARASIISKLTDWVQDDYTNPDRLFLMGVMLHFEGDPRGREFFEAASRMKRSGDLSHITAFVGASAAAVNPQDVLDQGIPKLNDKPLPINNPKSGLNIPIPGAGGPIPGAPVPMPDL